MHVIILHCNMGILLSSYSVFKRAELISMSLPTAHLHASYLHLKVSSGDVNLAIVRIRELRTLLLRSKWHLVTASWHHVTLTSCQTDISWHCLTRDVWHVTRDNTNLMHDIPHRPSHRHSFRLVTWGDNYSRNFIFPNLLSYLCCTVQYWCTEPVA